MSRTATNIDADMRSSLINCRLAKTLTFRHMKEFQNFQLIDPTSTLHEKVEGRTIKVRLQHTEDITRLEVNMRKAVGLTNDPQEWRL